ncbi:hypothetical protein ACHWQZ_G014670 [Mnemiopsis leidyi]
MIRNCLCRSRHLQLQARFLAADINHYKLLDIKEGASKKEIKAAYFKKAKQCHPDLYPNNPTKSEEYLQLQSSYDALMSSTNPGSVPDRGNNFAQEIDREFLKSVWRDPLPRDNTGLYLNSFLSSSLSLYYNKILNLLAILGLTGLALSCLFQFLTFSFSGDESEEDKERRERQSIRKYELQRNPH